LTPIDTLAGVSMAPTVHALQAELTAKRAAGRKLVGYVTGGIAPDWSTSSRR
jgi:hypothetical protein